MVAVSEGDAEALEEAGDALVRLGAIQTAIPLYALALKLRSALTKEAA